MTNPLETMSKRELKKLVLDVFINGVIEKEVSDEVYIEINQYEIWQDQPYSAARLEIAVSGYSIPYGTFIAYGFAKVKWPDEFDASFGETLASEKACSKLARQLYDHYHLPEMMRVNV